MAAGLQDCRIWLQVAGYGCRIAWLQDMAAGLQDCRIWLQDSRICYRNAGYGSRIAGYGCRIASLQDMAAG
jgi:hypothetical protein